MTPTERRQELLEILSRRRRDTYDNLAHEFNVSKITIRRDVAVLMCSYPVETVHGGRHGCVKVADWFVLDYRSTVQKTLTHTQMELLRRLGNQLAGDDLDTLSSILAQFAP